MTRRAALLAAPAAGWGLAIWLLWRSRVPATLHVPRLDEREVFSAAQLRRSASFSRVELLLWAAGVVVELAVLAAYAWRGHRFMRESAAGPLGTGMLLGMLGFAILWLASLPVSVADLWWQRRHDLARVGYADYVLGDWLALGGRFVFLCAALAVVMGFARLLGERWWLAASPVFVGLAALFAFVTPYLLSTHRLADPELRAASARLERRARVEHVPVVVEDVRDVTSLPNAETTGLGPSRRIVLWDTLVDGRLSEREVEVVIAHELGHVARGHVWKSVAWYALFAFPGAFVVARAVRRRGGMARPEAVPLALLVVVGLGVLAAPLENVVSRHLETEADWIALETTRDPGAARQLFRGFVPTTYSEPNPTLFEYVMLETHPTIMQRIALAEAWRRRRGARPGYATSDAQSP